MPPDARAAVRPGRLHLEGVRWRWMIPEAAPTVGSRACARNLSHYRPKCDDAHSREAGSCALGLAS
jgi:hypothetical protein